MFIQPASTFAARLAVRSTRSGAAFIRARGDGFLTLDQIRARVPSIFAEAPHESRSAKFTHIPTSAVLEGLMREGFVPVEASQGGSRQEGKADFTKHAIRLRLQDNAPAIVGRGDELYPEIMLMNAHDGTSAYKLIPAAYRVLCANGLVSSTSLGEQKVPHKGDVVREVIEGAFSVVKTLPQVVETAQAWSGIRLEQRAQVALADAVAALRWEPQEVGEQIVPTAPVRAEQLLQAKRPGDTGNDLWLTFNRLQEGVMKGGQSYHTRNDKGQVTGTRKVRPINGVDDTRRINQAMWLLTERMAAMVG